MGFKGRVLHVINSLGAGGAEVFVGHLAEALNAQCSVGVLVFMGIRDLKGEKIRQELEASGVQVFVLQADSALERLGLFLLVCRVIFGFRPDIIHAHGQRAEELVAIAKVLALGRPILVRTSHNERRRPAAIGVEALLDRLFDLTIACSSAAKLPWEGKSLRHPVIVVTNGIRIGAPLLGYNRDKRVAFRERLGLPANACIGLNIGRLFEHEERYQKGQDLIVQAAASPEFPGNVHILLVGDGNGKDKLISMVDRLDVRSKLTIFGIVEDPTELFCIVDFFLMPSRWEGLPIAAIEAACFGLPMVLSDIPPFREFADLGCSYCAVESSESLLQSIVTLVSSLDAFTADAAAARSLAMDRFSIARVAEKYIECYERISK